MKRLLINEPYKEKNLIKIREYAKTNAASRARAEKRLLRIFCRLVDAWIHLITWTQKNIFEKSKWTPFIYIDKSLVLLIINWNEGEFSEGDISGVDVLIWYITVKINAMLYASISNEIEKLWDCLGFDSSSK
jgi:hypothetical protein